LSHAFVSRTVSSASIRIHQAGSEYIKNTVCLLSLFSAVAKIPTSENTGMTGSIVTSEKTDKIGKSPNLQVPKREKAAKPEARKDLARDQAQGSSNNDPFTNLHSV